MLNLVASPTRSREGSLLVNLSKKWSVRLEMTLIKAYFRLGIYVKEFDLILKVFFGSKGRVDFGSGKWSVLQRAEWGKKGNCFDTSNLINSTFITCLFNLGRNEKEDDTHETSVNLKSQREIDHQNKEPHGSQGVLQTLVYSFAKMQRWSVQWSSKQSQVSNPEND